RPRECSVCKKTFIWSGHFKTHVLMHTGKRPHECSVCRKAFSESGTLKTHMPTYTRRK
ncbi:hypothetical protein CAPTEDRAFT_26326, partial [Capitella teleta]